MFSDVQLYKNMSRLVRLIGYNPRGFQPSTIEAYVVSTTGASLRNYQIPFYSRVDTKLTDSTGKKIYFSTKRDMSSKNLDNYDDSSVAGSQDLTENGSQAVTLYNGQWKLYPTIFTASGSENETFVLDGLLSDADQDKYVSHEFIDVFVKHFDESTGQWTFDKAWECDLNGIFLGYTSNTSTLFNNQTVFKSLYPGKYKVYTTYLNEEKVYELKFGNGIVGRKLAPGDKVYIFYLDSNGLDGQIDTASLEDQTLRFENTPDMFGLTEDEYTQIFFGDGASSGYSITDTKDYTIQFSIDSSSTPRLEENVDKIRENAPIWFSSGNRLVTKFDYEYYIRNVAGSKLGVSDLADVKCMNNWDYLATFYKWLYTLGTSGNFVKYADYLDSTVVASPTRYLTKDNFTRHDYFFADPADANNLYIWLKTSDDSFDAAATTINLETVLNPIKLMTAEIVACKAVDVCFDICACPPEYAVRKYLLDYDISQGFDPECESYIEVTLDDNSVYVPTTLQVDVANAIIQGFDMDQMEFGQTVDFSKILQTIYDIPGVARVRTVFQPSQQLVDAGVTSFAYDGLAFASWTNADNLVKLGDDLVVSNSSRKLEEFQFPTFVGASKLKAKNRIKIIRKSLSTVNAIKF